jgi:hypothetical protein
MIIYSRAAGLRRFWTWASNRRQRLSFIELMTLIQSPRFMALNATNRQNARNATRI